MASAEFTANFVATQITARPTEAKIVRKIIRALKAAGDPIVSVWDGEEQVEVSTEADIMAQAFNLDSLGLYTKSDAWVGLQMGEGLDIMADYSVSLEEALTPVNDWIDAQDY